MAGAGVCAGRARSVVDMRDSEGKGAAEWAESCPLWEIEFRFCGRVGTERGGRASLRVRTQEPRSPAAPPARARRVPPGQRCASAEAVMPKGERPVTATRLPDWLEPMAATLTAD